MHHTMHVLDAPVYIHIFIYIIIYIVKSDIYCLNMFMFLSQNLAYNFNNWPFLMFLYGLLPENHCLDWQLLSQDTAFP